MQRLSGKPAPQIKLIASNSMCFLSKNYVFYMALKRTKAVEMVDDPGILDYSCSCSTEMSMEFQLLVKTKLLTKEGFFPALKQEMLCLSCS